jgi:hypothetical protein
METCAFSTRPNSLKEEIHLVTLSERERLDAALGDLFMKWPDPGDMDIDEAALLEELADSFRGLPPLSNEIVAERRAGP